MHPAIFVFGTERRYANYKRAVEAAGGKIRFSTDLADAHGCRALLLPGGGDLEPWRYGQGNTASGGLEPERDEAEFRLLEQFTAAGKPVLGICRATGPWAERTPFTGSIRSRPSCRISAGRTARSTAPTIRQLTGWGGACRQPNGRKMG